MGPQRLEPVQKQEGGFGFNVNKVFQREQSNNGTDAFQEDDHLDVGSI